MSNWSKIKQLIKNRQISVPKDFSIVAIFDIIAKLLAALTSVLLIRFLSTSLYAEYVKFNSISSLVFGVVGTSMGVAFVRGGTEYTSRGYKCLKTIYAICISLLFMATLALVFLIPLLTHIYIASLGTVAFALIYGFVQSVNRVNGSFFQVKEKYTVAGLLDNAKHFFFIVFMLIAIVVIGEIGNIYLFFLFVISSFVPVFVGICLIKKEEKGIVDDKLGNETIKMLFSEAGTLIIYWLLLNMIDQTDIILVNRMLDETALSNYGVALKYYQLLLTLQASIATVLRIRTSNKDVVDSRERQREFSIKWIKKTGVYILGVVLVTNIFAAPVMNLLNGERYGLAIPAFRIFIFGAAISYLFAPNTAVMMSAKKHKLLCVYTTIGFVVNALIDLMLIPRWGIIAASLATVSGNAFLNMASFFTIVRRVKEK